MSRPIIRPATTGDFERFTATHCGGSFRSPIRIQGIVGELDGEIIAFGGISFWPDGTRLAFCDLTDKAREYPVLMHKAAKRTMAMADELGIKRIMATAVAGHPAAERWLLRLGFAPQKIGEATVYVREN